MPAALSTKAKKKGPLFHLPEDLRPCVDHLITEDDEPVESLYAERQRKLLTSPLYNWPGPGNDRPFLAMSNVGMFFAIDRPPLVPDVLLSLDVRAPKRPREKRYRSYFFWEYGKSPDTVLEIVSGLDGEEFGAKFKQYAELGIPYYVVWDPLLFYRRRSRERLHVFALNARSYVPLEKPWLAEVGLGLKVWQGPFDGVTDDWLRWCDARGKLIPTSADLADKAGQRARKAKKQARLAEQLTAAAEARATQAEQRAERLAAKLRELGADVPNGNRSE